MPGILYIVATPMGHKDDITLRALHILKSVDLIVAEDTRHSAPLLRHYGITTPLAAYPPHDEMDNVPKFLKKLESGQQLALISDAGTPLISDPGHCLVRAATAAGVRVVPIPGPCALIAALSASPLPVSAFIFEGFLPASGKARQTRLNALKEETRTLVFYEAPHRILAALEDMMTAFTPTRPAVFGRELTKMYESIVSGTLAELHARLLAHPVEQKGEFVIMIAGAPEIAERETYPLSLDAILQTLTATLPLKQAVALAVQLTGISKNQVYERALDRKVGKTRIP